MRLLVPLLSLISLPVTVMATGFEWDVVQRVLTMSVEKEGLAVFEGTAIANGKIVRVETACGCLKARASIQSYTKGDKVHILVLYQKPSQPKSAEVLVVEQDETGKESIQRLSMRFE